jgi:lysophospholipase L1-like esterase
LVSGQVLIAFGDSLTEGCGVSGQYYYDYYDGWVGRNDTYPLYLELSLQQLDQDITVKNFGYGGELTSEGVSRLDFVLYYTNDQPMNNLPPSYFLLMEGTNDLLFHIDTSTVRFNLSLMIDKIRAKGSEPVLASITPDPDHTWKEITKMNDQIRSLASEKNVLFVDQYNELVNNWYEYSNPSGCYNDHTHPNTLGFQAIAAVWYKNLHDVIIKQRPLPLPWLFLLLLNQS